MRNIIVTLLSFFALSVSAQDKYKELRPTSYNYQRGVEAIQKENMSEALDYLNKEIKDNPKNGYAFSWLALLHSQSEEYGRALTAADNSLKYLPKKDIEYVYFAYETRAKVYAELEDTIKALADYAMAIKINPDDDDAYERRAQIYYEQKKYTLADADYRKIISLNQGSVMGYMGIGRNRNDQKLWDEAIEQFDYVAKLYSDYSSVFGFRAESYIGKKDWDKATDDLISALKIDGRNKAFALMQTLEAPAFSKMKAKLKIQSTKEPNEAKWSYYLGVIHERKKKYRQAIRFYEEAQMRDASSVFLERIANCYDDEGLYDKCLETLNNALNMKPDDKDLLSMKANTLYELGLFKDAIAEWDSILLKYPDYAWGYYRRGWFKEGIGDDEGAIEDFNISSTLDPEYVYNYESRGNIYFRQGKKDLAMADFQKLIELENEPSRYETVQYAYQTLGQIDKAIEVMDSIIARDTTNVGNYYDAACLYSRLKMTDKALFYLNKCLSMGYKRFSHIVIDHDLDNIRELPEFKTLIQEYKGRLAKENEPEKEGTGVVSQSISNNFTEISFTKEPGNNLCNVKCSINDLPLYFIFDTGASDVSLSQVEATFMMKNGYLNKKDVIGKEYFSDAVGNVNVGTVINLRKVDFGGMELTNVKASVVQNQKAPLLLGQSVLGRLGKIEIDNSKRVLRIYNAIETKH